MQEKIKDLEDRTTMLERSMLDLTKEVNQVTKSMSSLSDSVAQLVKTLDRGKFLGYGVLIAIGAQTLGIKEVLEKLLGL